MFWTATKKILVILPAVLLEVLLIALLVTVLNPWATFFQGLFRVLGFLFALFVISYRQEGAYKILWLLAFSILPIPAALAYLLWGNKRTSKPIMRRIAKEQSELGISIDDTKLLGDVARDDKRISQSLSYVEKLTGAPLAACENVKYYPVGERCWDDMLIAMRGARKFIYLEYFIVQDGVMWGEMLGIMREKVKEGVDVRFIFDDLGSIATFSGRDAKALDMAGIKWLAFNKLKFISGTLNNRSHRKMLIIDGATVFSGGINLADEYINRGSKFGHWKDIGFRIEGPAVGNYLYMFAAFWNACSEDKIDPVMFASVPQIEDGSSAGELKPFCECDGAVLSYYDSPGNRDAVSNNFFIEMLGNATEYAWFYTPYLMLGDTLQDAFVRAAKRGVDVRIITPGIPDKKLVFRITRSYYLPLIAAGVKIYEYTPGFVHAKASLYDDKVCTIGTVNLDYRSLYLHFENNSIFVGSSVIDDLKADFLETQSKCHEIEVGDLKTGPVGLVLDGILRVFAPLC